MNVSSSFPNHTFRNGLLSRKKEKNYLTLFLLMFICLVLIYCNGLVFKSQAIDQSVEAINPHEEARLISSHRSVSCPSY